MKYKAVKRINNTKGCTCEGCAGSFSKEKCEEIANYVAERNIKSCVGSGGVIYVEVKSE
jgi:hypothetical protein